MSDNSYSHLLQNVVVEIGQVIGSDGIFLKSLEVLAEAD